MNKTPFILAAVLMLLSACGTPKLVSSATITLPAIQVEPPRNGQILITIMGGPVINKGDHWFPEGSTLAAVLDWTGINQDAPPRKVFLVDTDGRAVRCRVADRPRKNLERINIKHGTRIIVPWDRCFGLGPNKPNMGNLAIAFGIKQFAFPTKIP